MEKNVRIGKMTTLHSSFYMQLEFVFAKQKLYLDLYQQLNQMRIVMVKTKQTKTAQMATKTRGRSQLRT